MDSIHKTSILQRILNKKALKKVLIKIDTILNDEELESYYSSHKWIDKEYIQTYMIENKEKEKENIFSLYFATEYFKSKYKKEPILSELTPSEEELLLKYFFRLHRNFDKLFHLN